MWLPLSQPYSPLKLVVLLFLEPTPACHPLAFVHASTTVEASFFLHHLPLSRTSKPLPLLMAPVSRDYHTVKPSAVLSVQSLSRVRLFATPWITARQASLSITISRSLPKPMSIESVIPSNHLILCHPLLLPPSIFPSITVFSNESVLRIRWPKDWSFSFSISPSNEHPGLISFRMDWLDLLAVQGTLKSLRQHHSSKASILRRSAFFTVQFSHPYTTTGKTIALTRQTFVGKVTSLLFKVMSLLFSNFCLILYYNKVKTSSYTLFL